MSWMTRVTSLMNARHSSFRSSHPGSIMSRSAPSLRHKEMVVWWHSSSSVISLTLPPPSTGVQIEERPILVETRWACFLKIWRVTEVPDDKKKDRFLATFAPGSGSRRLKNHQFTC
jgi:hypothetical protein